ncbi:MAG TPA: hypothetical protein VI759_10455 [Dehalococcoidia bacterium]|nr:hypothetical protein [Dehalococcoidia bacterium]
MTSLQCSGGWVTANIAWTPDAGLVQWVDLTSWNAGFAPGTFGGWGPLAGNQGSLSWPGLYPNTNYYIRVNTFTGSVWQPSQTIVFNSGSCQTTYPGATNLTAASQQCQTGGWVQATFAWAPSGLGTQFVDLTTVNANFAPFTYGNWGPLAAGQNSLTWPGLYPNTTYYARVNTLTATGWWPSQTLVFKTRSDCQTGTGPATGLNLVAQLCQSANYVIATFNWTPSSFGSQWVELTSLNKNFAAGTYASWGPLSPSVTTFGWPGLFSNTTYYVRVSTLTAAGWAVSQTLTFTTITCGASGFSTGDKSFDGTATGTNPAILSDIYVEGHPGEGFDRIVIEFEGAFPDGTVEYIDAASACGSGLPVALDGEAILAIRMQPAQAHEDGVPTVPVSVPGTGFEILEAEQTCDFEGVVVWVIGVDELKGFRVTVLTGPSRLVIDILR